MKSSLHVNLPQSAPVHYSIVFKSLKNMTSLVRSFYSVVIITDHHVKKLHVNFLIQKLKGQRVFVLSIPAGEKSKNNLTKAKLESQMLQNQCGKDTLILAFGGGVVGDLAGFIAATYMRGIAYVQIPTTLLAMVDSSIGGKTAVNTRWGKNLIGAFWHPQTVIIDVNYLKTLSRKHIINGLIEAFKMFLTHDKKSFHYLHNNLKAILNLDLDVITRIVRRALKIKASIVAQDEKENNIRATLNFGHTIGHALEKLTNYKLLHGYAVGYGILIEAKISQLLGLLDNKTYDLVASVLCQLGIKNSYFKKLDIDIVIQQTQLDKKNRGGKTHFILLKDIGSVDATPYPISNSFLKKTFSTVKGSSLTYFP